MSRPLVVRPEAESDSAEARDWYERQRPGLGGEFLTAVEDAFELIKASPEAYAVVYRDVRRVGLRRYPYIAYYRTTTDAVEVLAVLHASRDPRVWRSRA
ncbi:MAG: hypothetical protein AVDCRST_MAG64-3559 [uncultured Phycisphaerae bacterium]|uniref:Death on curing protein, Doc toxin n=1 Tax=uncultured Phycisphaerae bacterium TaxID=904963 RepID=A0A6J4Q3C1_9BACT|nr:MAG: hypothetical protein AVDCRST_MAG64-3559 [uncultured Phycisphaerae bacterium]